VKIAVFMENNQFGGVDTFCATLLNNWPENDSFVLICNKTHPGHEQLRQSLSSVSEFKIVDIPLSWVLSKRWFSIFPILFQRASQPLLRILLYPVQIREISKLFRNLNADALIVLNGGFPGGETSRIANIAWENVANKEQAKHNIHNFHNFAVPPRRGFGWYENWLDRKLLASTSQLISVSRKCAQSLKVRATFRNFASVNYIYNGIDESKAYKISSLQTDLRKSLRIGDAPLCLILANYEPRKGYSFLFEAFALVAKSLPDVHLVACGGGTDNERAAVESARNLLAPKANIHLLGFVHNGADLINQSDLLLISSQSFESFGLSAVEAMIRGIPVVATRCGGLPEALGNDGEAGYLVDIDDPISFSERILLLLRDSDLRYELGGRGKKRAHSLFTAVQMATKYEEVLKSGILPEISPDSNVTSLTNFTSEWRYIIRRCYSITMVLQCAHVIATAITRRILNRLLYQRMHRYPRNVRVLANTISIPQLTQYPTPNSTLPDGPRRLKLATGYLYFDDQPNWDTTFDDHEMFVSLHRWNWLLRALTDEEIPPDMGWGFALMRSWLNAMSVLPKGDAGESYTTGERIVNTCLYARHISGGWEAIPADITTALGQMAYDLSQRVEYHGGDLSGNHVVNNARALLFAGHCCNFPQLIDLGRALLCDRLPILVSDGFLREGSSHYQFLFTRWLLELRLLTVENGDNETFNLLDSYLPSLIHGCHFFRVYAPDYSFIVPTIGDISPDCEPVWLWDLVESPLSHIKTNRPVSTGFKYGWANLFNDYQAPLSDLFVGCSDQITRWIDCHHSGWYRLDHQGWTAIWHAESSSGPAISSHSHHDFGSLVLYRHGKEVLIDPGRLDYSGSTLGNYGVEGIAHNLVTINGRPPMLSRGDRLLPEQQRNASCSVKLEEDEDGEIATVTITHSGFKRILGRSGNHSRSFIFTSDYVEILDHINGHDSHWLEWRFHRPDSLSDNSSPSISIDLIDSSNPLNESKLECTKEPIGGWRFTAYGIKEKAMTHSFSAETMLPIMCRYRIRDKVLP